MAADMRSPPRVLVTGFESFPGAPVNPTAWLAATLALQPPSGLPGSHFRTAVLPVDYRAVRGALETAAAGFDPDIAIHFGLAASCRGFRLERTGRNRFASAPLDNRGWRPPDGPIVDGAATFQPTLPLLEVHAALTAAGLPVEWSDDAGGYMCNAAMVLSLAGLIPGLAPKFSGFVHVPLAGKGAPLSPAQLLVGARIVIATAVGAFRGPEASRPLSA